MKKHLGRILLAVAGLFGIFTNGFGLLGSNSNPTRYTTPDPINISYQPPESYSRVKGRTVEIPKSDHHGGKTYNEGLFGQTKVTVQFKNYGKPGKDVDLENFATEGGEYNEYHRQRAAARSERQLENN